MKLFLRFSILIILLGGLNNYSLLAQDSIVTDSVITPFRKGRWIVGLSGSINSTRNETLDTDSKNFSSQFGINISGGNFVKDRWNIGGTLSLNRTNRSGENETTSESLFVGPTASYYMSKTSYGSLYLSLSPGYVRYRDFLILVDEDTFTQQNTEGDGFGLRLGFGYSYVIWDRIAFDIGINWNLFYISAEEVFQPSGNRLSGDIQISNVDFNFGFRVLLDKLLY